MVALLLGEALTLAVCSALHLAGALRVGSGDSDGAGIAEGVICVVLVAGAGALARDPAGGRRVALASIVFAILGFIIGLTFTLRGGDAIDVAYHVSMTPVLVAMAALLSRRYRRGRG